MKIARYLMILVFGIAIGWKLGSRSVPSTATAAFTKPEAGAPSQRCEISTTAPATLAPQKEPGKTSALSGSNKPRLPALNEQFWNAFNSDDFDKARAVLDEMAQQHRDSREYQEGLTRLLVRTRDYDKAKPALEQCLQLFPDSRSCLVDRVDMQLSAGTRDDQLNAAEACLQKYPENPPCLNDLAIIRMHENRFDEAVTIYQKLLDTNGSFGFRFKQEMLHSQMGFALEGSGRLAEAARQFDIACRSNWPGACGKSQELSRNL